MEALLPSIVASILACIFCYAGIAKLWVLDTFKQSLIQFDVPERLVPIATVSVPLFELLIGLSLVIAPTIVPGSIAGIVLLGCFLIAISRLLVQGRKPACACFGSVSSEPIGARSLVRNVVLISLFVVVLISVQQSRFDSIIQSIDRLSDLQWVVPILLLSVCLVLVATISLSMELSTQAASAAAGSDALDSGRLESLPFKAGTTVPDILLPNFDDGFTAVKDLLGSNDRLIVLFLSSGCSFCGEAVLKIPAWAQIAPHSSFAIITRDRDYHELSEIGTVPQSHILIDDGMVFQLTGIRSVPALLSIGRDGRAESDLASGSAQIREYWRHMADIAERT